MGRWYQNGLTGEQVEVKDFAEEDKLGPPWSRIPAPPESVRPAAKKAPAKAKDA
jgi:hypothetical protein